MIQDEPPELDHKCPKWLRDYLEHLRLFAIACQPLAGLGITISEPTTKGRVISANEPIEQTTTPHPFKLINASAGGTFRARVVYGTVESITPEGMTLGDAEPFLITLAAGEGKIWVKVTVAEELPTVVEIEAGDGAEIPVNTSEYAYREIGSYNAEGTRLILANSATKDMNFISCAGEHHIWT